MAPIAARALYYCKATLIPSRRLIVAGCQMNIRGFRAGADAQNPVKSFFKMRKQLL